MLLLSLEKLETNVRKFVWKKLNIQFSQFDIPISLIKHLEKRQHITFIDVGAYNGEFARALGKYCKILRGILVEPLPHKAESLRKKFNSARYKVVECALSAESGFVELEVNEFEPTSSMLRIKREMPELSEVALGSRKIIQCKACTLDDMLSEEGMDSLDLLKIDAQGAEHLIIAGARKTLDITSMIWLEVSFKPLYEMSSTFFDIYKLLYDRGFKFYELEPGFRGSDGELLQGDALFIRE